MNMLNLNINLEKVLDDKCKKTKNLTKKFLKNKNENYKYIILDVNSLTIVPYIKDYSYTNGRMNITPTVRTIEFYMKLKSIYPSAKFIVVVDNGISSNMKKIYPDYKGHRRHSMKSNLLLSLEKSNNVYRYNISLIGKFIIPLGEYFSIEAGEADFKIGYIIKYLNQNLNVDPEDILTIAGDKDLILTSELSHFIYKSWRKRRGREYYFFYKDNFICANTLLKVDGLTLPIHYLFYKALVGDKSDNIPGVLTPKKSLNLIKKILEEKGEITVHDIIDKFDLLFKNKTEKELKVNRFYINLTIMNLFNENIFSEGEKMNLDKGIKKFIIEKTDFNKEEIMTYYRENLFNKLYPLKSSIIEFVNDIKKGGDQ